MIEYGLWWVNGGFFERPGTTIEPELQKYVGSNGKFYTTDINIAYKALTQIEKWRDTTSSSLDWKWEVRERE